MKLRSKIAGALFLFVSAASAAALVLRMTAPKPEAQTDRQTQESIDFWERASEIEPDADYIIVSNGYALTSTAVTYGDYKYYSFAGVPVSTEGGVPAGEITPEMLWRFKTFDETLPGGFYYSGDDFLITQNGAPLTRDIHRGDEYMRFCLSLPGEIPLPENIAWQILCRGNSFYLSAVSGSEDTNNMLYYSKHYKAFVYINNYPHMTQRLFAVKLFRCPKQTENLRELKTVGIMLEPPEAGRPALSAYTAENGCGYFILSTDWSGVPAVFASSTEYYATIKIKAAAGFVFAGDTAVTVNGMPAAAKTGENEIIVSLKYPPTGKAYALDITEDPQPDTLLITSDIHKDTEKLKGFLVLLRASGAYPRTVSFAGDMYTGGGGYFYTGWDSYAKHINDLIASVYPASQPVYTMGNHDWESLYDEDCYNGEAGTCFPAIFGCSRVGAIYPGGEMNSSYVIFNLGATDVTYGEYYSMFRESDIEKLRMFLEITDGSGRLIVINSHWPLHYAYNSGEREVQNAETVIDLLNKYSTSNDIVFVWGHNHNGDPSMLTALGAGDKVICDKAGSITRGLKFTYANAGAMLHGTALLLDFEECCLHLEYLSYPGDGADALESCGSYIFSRAG